VADRVDAVVHAMQAPIGDPSLRLVAVDPGRAKLLGRDPAVLDGRETGDLGVEMAHMTT
jgi:hypothetical protein